MLVFDQMSEGIVGRRIMHSPQVNTHYASTFYNESTGPLVADSVIIGNTNNSDPYSITTSGLVLAWDRGQLLKSVYFYNFPDSSSWAIKGHSLPSCLYCGGWVVEATDLKFHNVKYKTMHRWDFDYVLHDQDGSISGRKNDYIVYNNDLTIHNQNCVNSSGSFLNGTTCANSNNWIRFAFNNPRPEYAVMLNISNQGNYMTFSPKRFKRLTHGLGFMCALETQQGYLLEFDAVSCFLVI